MPSSQDQPPDETPAVVAIGASAGGLDALKTFFSTLPDEPDAAFVVVMHLAPDHPSELASILGRETRMPVTTISGKVALEPNHVYVVPPDRRLELSETAVKPIPFAQAAERHGAVDLLFRSLADHRGNGFAVILSGGGSDGAVGVKAVKEHGGVILVQDPSEADFDSMPRAAINTGVADMVLPVGELAERLAELIQDGDSIRRRLPAPEALEADEQTVLRRIISFLNTRTGYDFSHYKRSTVLRRATRRMQVHGLRTLEEYLRLLRNTAEEAQGLFGDMLISVTSFFRDAPAWEALQRQVIPALFDARPEDEPLRVWVAGCASGEEAYSLAMLLVEEAERRNEPREIQLFASDLDDRALALAREGRYGLAIEADVSAERLSRFFVREEDHYQVDRELRDRVLFAHHSVLRDPPFARQDLVSCRNLLIYLDQELQQQVYGVLRYALRPGGYLFLGVSEHAGRDYFTALDKQHHIYRAREVSGHAPPILPEMLTSHQPAGRNGRESEMTPRDRSSLPATHRAVLEELGPPSVLVDDQRRALRLSETAGRYLELPEGPPEHDITRLVRHELQAELSAALFAAFDKNQQTLSAFVPVQFNGTPRSVAVLVQPRPARRGVERLALVMFLDCGEARPATALAGETEASPAVVQRLQEELSETRTRLRTAREEFDASNEELRAANEELQSLNEEYRSTGEELETSKEELQSINEELQTVNSELKSKLEEISRAHSDLENLVVATEIPTLFLDRELCIQRFTPQLAQLFSIKSSDQNRPIRDLNRCLQYDTLEQDAARVLCDLVPLEREVASDDGHCYLARLRPYRTADHRIDGVVLTFVDITEQKQAETIVRDARHYAESIVETMRQPLLVLTDDLCVDSANPVFYETFGVTPEETLGRGLFTLGNGQWDIPELRQLLEDVLPQNNCFDGYRVSHDFENVGARIMLLDGRRLDRLQRVLLVVEDITEREQARRALRQSEEQFRALVHASSDVIYRMSPDWSEMRLLVDGVFVADPAKPRQSWLEHHIPVEDRPGVQQAIAEAIRTKQVFEQEHRFVREDGSLGWTQSRAIPIFDETGEISEWLGMASDITARKELAQSLQELNQTLEARVAERTSQVKQLADRLRALARQLSQTEQRERKRLAKILHDHVQQLIAGARIQVGTLKRDLSPELRMAAAEKLEETLDEALHASRSLAVELIPPILHEAGLIDALKWLAARMRGQHDLNVHLRADSNAEPATEDIRFLVFECVRELLLNVVKHAKVHEAEVALMRASDTDIKVVVQDQGQGFDPEALNIRGADVDSFGLFSIQERLRDQRGRIEIRTAPGQGTQVTLILPSPRAVSAADEPKDQDQSVMQIRAKSGICRLLIVDDQEIIREGLTHLFDFESDIEVVGHASDGPEAIAAAETLTPDVVLMDINLGDMDGIEATRQILARQPDIKVIGLSMHTDPAVAEAMRNAGAVEYLSKGGRPEDLMAAIRACRKG